MNILVDENIPHMTIKALLESGHHVIDIRGTEKEGIDDELLWELAKKEKCLLITTDKGFSSYREENHYGILIILLKQPNRHKIHEKTMKAIQYFKPDEWPGLLISIKDTVFSLWRKDS